MFRDSLSFGFGGLILVFTLRQGLFCRRPSLAAYVAYVKMPEAKLRMWARVRLPHLRVTTPFSNFVAAVRLILAEGAPDEMILPNLLIPINGACFEALLNHR